ncbi:MAG: hypothetical protein ACOYN0_11445 [Phycisphaerales bacterium]
MNRSRKSRILSLVGLAAVGACVVGAGQAAKAHADGRRAAFMVGELYVEGQGLLPAERRERARELFEQLGALVGARVQERADANSDGTLDAQELQAAGDTMRAAAGKLRAAALLRFDQDLDGSLAEGERDNLRSHMRSKAQRLFASADADSNGRLSDDEIRAAAKAGVGDAERTQRLTDAGIAPLLSESDRAAARQIVGELVITVRTGLLQNFDADKSGTLDESERATLRQRAIARAQEIKSAATAAGDTNGDGALRGDERKAMVRRLVVSWMGLKAR